MRSTRAGGPTRAADLSLVNLAAPLADGQQVVVPRRGPPGSAPVGVQAAAGAKVSLAIATVEQLDELPGHRADHGAEDRRLAHDARPVPVGRRSRRDPRDRPGARRAASRPGDAVSGARTRARERSATRRASASSSGTGRRSSSAPRASGSRRRSGCGRRGRFSRRRRRLRRARGRARGERRPTSRARRRRARRSPGSGGERCAATRWTAAASQTASARPRRRRSSSPGPPATTPFAIRVPGRGPSLRHDPVPRAGAARAPAGARAAAGRRARAARAAGRAAWARDRLRRARLARPARRARRAARRKACASSAGGAGSVASPTGCARTWRARLARGTTGERRALLAGIVLGEDAGIDRSPARRVRGERSHAPARRLRPEHGDHRDRRGHRRARRRRRSARRARRVAILVVLSYALAVGWQPSVVRAAVAGVLASLAWIVARPRDRWHALARRSARAPLLAPGVCARARVPAVVRGRRGDLRRRCHASRGVPDAYPVPRGLWDVVVVAVACGVVTAPIVWLHFGAVALWTVPANVAAEPAMPPLIGLSLARGRDRARAPGRGGRARVARRLVRRLDRVRRGRGLGVAERRSSARRSRSSPGSRSSRPCSLIRRLPRYRRRTATVGVLSLAPRVRRCGLRVSAGARTGRHRAGSA